MLLEPALEPPGQGGDGPGAAGGDLARKYEHASGARPGRMRGETGAAHAVSRFTVDDADAEHEHAHEHVQPFYQHLADTPRVRNSRSGSGSLILPRGPRA
jgi:hypothetical protein